MKKSKIIVPALGIIALSTAASITGTVAWFTASRSATITAGNFAVTKVSNNLEVKLQSGIGTLASANNDEVNVKSGFKLTDASFDHTTKNVYNPDADGKVIEDEFLLSTASESTGDNVRSTGDETVLSVMTFDMAISVEFGSISGDLALYLAPSSKFEVRTAVDPSETWSSTSTDFITGKGFRVAFVPKATADAGAGAVSRVWADQQAGANCAHVNALTTTSSTAIDGVPYAKVNDKYTDLVDSAYSDALPGEGDAGITAAEAAARPDYLGKFTFAANSKVTINYTVVCWFEGTDENIVNRASADEYQTVRANFTLETRKLKATA